MTKYVHLALNEDVYSRSGYYTPLKEVRLKHNGREILYVIGQVNIEASCCGCANWAYALVPGYVVNWQNDKNQTGLPVSEVESISDEEVRKEVREAIREAENINAVEFW